MDICEISAVAVTPSVLNDLRMPAGFKMDCHGLWVEQKRKDDDEERHFVLVSARFEVAAEARDAEGGEWGLLLRWEDRDGCKHQWVMPRSMLHGDAAKIAERLESGGLACVVGSTAYFHLKRFLASVEPTHRVACVTRTGWHASAGKHVFVSPWGRTYGGAGTEVILQSDRLIAADTFTTAGTLADWQREIASYAVGNDRLALFVAAAFAGPLLDLTSESSGGINLFGKSQTGKTTCAVAAGSVWGRGDRGAQVRQWRATANGLEAVAAETSDTILILDEMGQADPREVGEIVYQLANEGGKLRAGRGGEARRRRTWHTLFLSTGELTLAAKMGEAGKQVKSGLDVRLVSLPADAGAGLGVFQALHGKESAKDVADHLRDAARTWYGTAARAFLTHLAADRAEDAHRLRASLDGLRQAFLGRHCPAAADGQVRSVATRFALIGAAGELACNYGILPWPEREALRAAGACFEAWLAERGGIGAGEDRAAIEQVRGFIETHGASRFERIDDHDAASDERIVNRAGFRRKASGTWEYLILPDAWRTQVCAGLDAKRAARSLAAAGYLKPDSKGKHSRTVRVAGYGAMRLYVLGGLILGVDPAEDTDDGE